MQRPSPEQFLEYNAQLQEHIRRKCPNIDVEKLEMKKVAFEISGRMDTRQAHDPDAELIEVALLPINSRETRLRGILYNASVTHVPLRGLMTGLQSTFHKELSFWQFLLVTRTRVPMKNFCNPAETIPEGSTCSICICKVTVTSSISDEAHEDPDAFEVTDLNDKADGEIISDTDEVPVVTTCGHCFHETFLDAWVNDSAIRTAN
ncbi:hypothetical protein CC86DRAFT_418291 [Ophiobolus disseminans]|uniref:RING-type domain-containing protein n=1 Tax=Ophiobolus disseminans TaxID=1469910 RepID=A0A6A6ZYK8_9PLEO|nr:hypothetical protein CC86DRAFT_418291 [Ophiobolus disseminans]